MDAYGYKKPGIKPLLMITKQKSKPTNSKRWVKKYLACSVKTNNREF
jgi:hypothetical protein